jgi:hypothetical protein
MEERRRDCEDSNRDVLVKKNYKTFFSPSLTLRMNKLERFLLKKF